MTLYCITVTLIIGFKISRFKVRLVLLRTIKLKIKAQVESKAENYMLNLIFVKGNKISTKMIRALLINSGRV